MILTVDIGNTNTCFALYGEGECIGQWRLSTNRLRTADEFTLWLENFLERFKGTPHAISTSIVACVVPGCRFAILSALENWLGVVPYQVTQELMESLGVKVELTNPQEVGADRLINAYAAWQQTQNATIVIDFGTATTFDICSATGAYCGGVIAPGINLSLEALHRAAARLPSVEVKRPEAAIGRNTETAMQSGLYFGYLGMIDRIVAEIKAELSQKDVTVLATGGLAPLFAKNSDAIDLLDSDLTMRGLHLVAKSLEQAHEL